MNKGPSRLDTLESEGWTRRFIACEPRLSEAIDMYRLSGFDVLLEPLPKGTDCKSCSGDDREEVCRICFEGFEDQYKIIFTRPGKSK